MKYIFLIYIITQVFTNAYAFAVIESVKPLVVKELHNRGYVKNKNSLYNFNYTFYNILRGFIPFYYLRKALKLVKSNGNIEAQADELIDRGKYVLEDEDKNEIRTFGQEEEKEEDLSFIESQKYSARKNDYYKDYYKTYQTDIEYSSREATKEDNLEITPFINEPQIVNQTIVKNEVTNLDIAKAICGLDVPELVELIEKMSDLKDIKTKNKKLKLEKDIA